MTDSALALVGYSASDAQLLRENGIVAISLAKSDPDAMIDACHTLGFSGALIRQHGPAWFGAVDPDPDAQRAKTVDAIAFAGRLPHIRVAQGLYTFPEAVADALIAHEFKARGARLLILGSQASDLLNAISVARLGWSDIGIAARDAPEAERVSRMFPAVNRMFPISRYDAALGVMIERSDLIILTHGDFPMLQPYHVLLNLTHRTRRTDAHVMTLQDLHLFHLSRQLWHATGIRYQPHTLPQLTSSDR